MVIRPPFETLVQQSEAVKALANRIIDRAANTAHTKSCCCPKAARLSVDACYSKLQRQIRGADLVDLCARLPDVSRDTLRKLTPAWQSCACSLSCVSSGRSIHILVSADEIADEKIFGGSRYLHLCQLALSADL